MKKSLLIICGIISCLLLATLASAKSPAAEERGVDLANYSSEDLSSNSAVVLHETPILANSSTPAVGSETSSGTDFSDYETDEAVKRKIADGVYEILDSDGTVIAIYQDTKREAQPRVGWAIDWTVDAGVNTGADSRFSSYDGLNFSYDIDFSRTGSSKIGYARHDQQRITWVEESTDGFFGGFTFTKNVGSVSLAIKNNSSNTITYSGVYYVS